MEELILKYEKYISNLKFHLNSGGYKNNHTKDGRNARINMELRIDDFEKFLADLKNL